MPAEVLNVAIVGCGLIGRRRGKIASKHPSTIVSVVADNNLHAAKDLAEELDCKFTDSWQDAIADDDIDLVVVSTPNGYLREIAISAMQQKCHVLIEKPMGRNLDEAMDIARVAREAGMHLKVGFNHRYHPAIEKTLELINDGVIGEIINVRGVYGHGGRPGYENEWRGDPVLAGGGELTDQGVHILDLLHIMLGTPAEAVSFLQTAAWPIEPLEDNGFALLRYGTGAIATFHTSWTQWKNKFSLIVHGTLGSLNIEGLGGSYGTETLTVALRNMAGGVPEMKNYCYKEADRSWDKEWAEFITVITENKSHKGWADQGIAVMRTLNALYQSANTNQVVCDILKPAVFLDRDGVLNQLVERNGELVSPRTFDEFEWIDGVSENVNALKHAGFLVLVVTNQPDIARGKMSQQDLDLMNECIVSTLKIDDLYACTCDDGDDCPCRKPKAGMLVSLGQRHGIDFDKSYIVGDSAKDIGAGSAVGVTTILIDREYNLGTSADIHVSDLKDAVGAILAAH